MTNLKKIFTILKKPVIWTFFYVFTLFLLLYILFDFNIFVKQHWIILSRARLHGIAGFTFGLILFASIPTYFATLYMTITSGKYPINFPNFLPKKTKTETPKPEEKIQDTEPEPEKFPDGMPSELIGAYLKARRFPSKIVNFNKSEIAEINPKPESKHVKRDDKTDTALDLDFSFDALEPEKTDALNFTEMSFNSTSPEPSESKSELTEIFDIIETKYETREELIIVSDFVIMEFHSSEQLSNIEKLSDISKSENKKPILYIVNDGDKNNTELKNICEKLDIKIIDTISDIIDMTE